MTVRLDPVPSPPRWEKQGNTIWVACRSCNGWFPVEGGLLADGTAKCWGANGEAQLDAP